MIVMTKIIVLIVGGSISIHRRIVTNQTVHKNVLHDTVILHNLIELHHANNIVELLVCT